jgi:hypothetical protein
MVENRQQQTAKHAVITCAHLAAQPIAGGSAQHQHHAVQACTLVLAIPYSPNKQIHKARAADEAMQLLFSGSTGVCVGCTSAQLERLAWLLVWNLPTLTQHLVGCTYVAGQQRTSMPMAGSNLAGCGIAQRSTMERNRATAAARVGLDNLDMKT